MKKIVTYGIASGKSDWQLEKSVLGLIEKGWQPLGGVSSHEGYLMQAVVKYEEEPAKELLQG